MNTFIKADFTQPAHATALTMLMNAYALDPMGGAEAIDPKVLAALPAQLAQRDDTFSILAYADGEPVGLANCMIGFSTFAGRELVNVHDLVVLDSHRYQGLGKALLAEVEQHALAIDACKVTLEVLQNNAPARKAYADVGFVPYELAPGAGVAEFWQKKLNTNHK